MVDFFKRRCPFAYEWITTVLRNIIICIHNLFVRQDPWEYWLLPKWESIADAAARRATLLPYRTTAAVNPENDSSSDPTTTTTEMAPPIYGQYFQSWLSSEYSFSGGPMDGGSHTDHSGSSAGGGGGMTDVTTPHGRLVYDQQRRMTSLNILLRLQDPVLQSSR